MIYHMWVTYRHRECNVRFAFASTSTSHSLCMAWPQNKLPFQLAFQNSIEKSKNQTKPYVGHTLPLLCTFYILHWTEIRSTTYWIRTLVSKAKAVTALKIMLNLIWKLCVKVFHWWDLRQLMNTCSIKTHQFFFCSPPLFPCDASSKIFSWLLIVLIWCLWALWFAFNSWFCSLFVLPMPACAFFLSYSS